MESSLALAETGVGGGAISLLEEGGEGLVNLRWEEVKGTMAMALEDRADTGRPDDDDEVVMVVRAVWWVLL